jgi:hypothetical protein
MPSNELWNNSSSEVIRLPSGCRLATRRALSAGAASNAFVLTGDRASYLVKKGEEEALRKCKTVLLKLTTGRRGRPTERIILPPKPGIGQPVARLTVQATRKEDVKAKSKTPTGVSATLPRPIDHALRLQQQVANMRCQLKKAQESIGQLKRQFMAVQATRTTRPDLEEEVVSLRSMVETMRRSWREAHGYAPEHPELQPISQ